jgi:O-antigen biosynthesis protein WbqV
LSKIASRVRRIRALGIVHDAVCAALALPVAFLVRTGELPDAVSSFWFMQGTLVIAAVICFYLIGLNRGSWRYASIQEFLRIAQASILAVLIAVLATFAFSRLEMIPRAVPAIACFLLIGMMTATRVAYRVLKERHFQRMFSSDNGGERVLLVGYSDEGSAFIRHLAMQRSPAYHVVGIIDLTQRHIGRRQHSVKVLGGADDLAEIIERFRNVGMPVSKLVLSPSKVDPDHMERLLVDASELGVSVFTLPDISELNASGGSDAIKPTVIKLDDLLGRPVANIDLAPVAELLRDKVIVVTGGGGSIGSGLVEQALSYFPRRLVIIDSSEHNLYSIELLVRERYPYQDIRPIIADVRDAHVMRRILNEERPEIVFHAAALKHVPMVEHNPIEGARTNVLGTVNLAEAAVEAGVAIFVMISTDKAVNPTNVMGATKRFAEAYCQMLDRRDNARTRFMTVRFGNVLGSSGSVVPLFSRQIDRGGPLTVTHPEMKRYFMSMKEAVRLVLAASAKSAANPAERGKILVLHMGTQVKIVEIAERMIRLAGLRPNVDIAINFTGLRPGEKLYEERLAASELVEPTEDSWLQIATPRDSDAATILRATTDLRDAIAAQDEARALVAIRIVVPELVSAPQLPAAAPVREPAVDPIAFEAARRRLRT